MKRQRGNPIIKARMPPALIAEVRSLLGRLACSSEAPRRTVSDFIRQAVEAHLAKYERSRTWRRRKADRAKQRAAGKTDDEKGSEAA